MDRQNCLVQNIIDGFGGSNAPNTGSTGRSACGSAPLSQTVGRHPQLRSESRLSALAVITSRLIQHMVEDYMRLRLLFIINIFFAVFFGVSCTFFPRFVFWLYGLIPDEMAIWSTRLVGGAILGFGTLMWFGSKTTSVDTRRAIALALLIQDAVGCAASLLFQLTGMVNIFGWFSLALYGVLALAYAFFLFIRPNAA